MVILDAASISELDILALLSKKPMKGIKKNGSGPIADLPVYHIHQPFNNVMIPGQESNRFLNSVEDVLSAEFVFKQSKAKKQVATLFSINRPGRMSPELRILLSPYKSKLLLHFNSSKSGSLKNRSLYLTKKEMDQWIRLAIVFQNDSITVFVNCQVHRLKVHGGIKLNFNEDSLIYFRQEPGRKRQFVVS